MNKKSQWILLLVTILYRCRAHPMYAHETTVGRDPCFGKGLNDTKRPNVASDGSFKSTNEPFLTFEWQLSAYHEITISIEMYGILQMSCSILLS